MPIVRFMTSTMSAKPLPSAFRAPATIWPFRQSSTSPAALTTASAPMTTSPSAQAGGADPALHPAGGVRPQHASDGGAGAGADVAFGDRAVDDAASQAW